VGNTFENGITSLPSDFVVKPVEMLAHLKRKDIYAKLTEKVFMAQMTFFIDKVVSYFTLRSDALKVGLAVQYLLFQLPL